MVEPDSPQAGKIVGSLTETSIPLGALVERKITSSELQGPEVERVMLAVVELPGGALPLAGCTLSVKSTFSNERVKEYLTQLVVYGSTRSPHQPVSFAVC